MQIAGELQPIVTGSSIKDGSKRGGRKARDRRARACFPAPDPGKCRPRWKSQNRDLPLKTATRRLPVGHRTERVPSSPPRRRTSQNPSPQVASIRGRIIINKPAFVSEFIEEIGAADQSQALSQWPALPPVPPRDLAPVVFAQRKKIQFSLLGGRSFKIFERRSESEKQVDEFGEDFHML